MKEELKQRSLPLKLAALVSRQPTFMLQLHSVILLFTSLCCLHSAFAGSDGFSDIRCDAGDVAKALIGKKMSNERVVVLEKRHEDLGLKDLGADEITERLFCISWLICGAEYMLLEDNSTVRDVLKIPAHSKESPLFLGSCDINGKETKTIVVAILNTETESGATLPAKTAWKIDEKTTKFVSLPTEGLRCPRSGIISLDGVL
jgi:hypothetical protein